MLRRAFRLDRLALLCGTALLCAAPALAQARRGTLIVTNKSSSTASIISLATGQVVAELPTGNGPHEVAASSNGRWAVVTDYGTGQAGGSSLTVIDVAGKRVARTVNMGTYTRPHGVQFLPGDSLVAVTSEASRNVVLVRVADGTIVKAIATGQPASHMLAITASADRIFTGNISAGNVSELNVARGEVTRTFPVPPQPEAITVSHDGEEVWIGSNSGGIVSVLRTRDSSVTTVATGLGWPYRILITPDRRHVLIPDYRGEALRLLDYSSRAERGRIALAGAGPQGIAITPDSRTAFLSLSTQNRVAIVDLATFTISGYVPAGTAPDGVAFANIDVQP